METLNPQNERIKRRYFTYLREARRYNEATVDGVAKALNRFETYTKFRSFKAFHIQQAVAFKRHLAEQPNTRTGEKLSKATLYSTLNALRNFFHWLAGQPGFRSRLSYSDADYFNLSDKESRVAKAHREQRVPFNGLATQFAHRGSSYGILGKQTLHEESAFAVQHDCAAAGFGVFDVQVTEWGSRDPFAVVDLVPHAAHGIVGQPVDVLLGKEDLGFPHEHLAAAGAVVQDEAFLYEVDLKSVVDPEHVEVDGVPKVARDAVDVLAQQRRHRIVPVQECEHLLELLADLHAGALGEGELLYHGKALAARIVA